MSKSNLEVSLESRAHQVLQAMIGKWEGTTKTWFEPGVLADESPMTGTIRSILGQRFVQYKYKGNLNGEPFEGMAIFGFDIQNDTFQSSWIDSFHLGTGIMLSTGIPVDNGFSVLGSYGSPEMPEPWGWRTVVQLTDHHNLIITAYNISPDGQEDKATETIYQRIE